MLKHLLATLLLPIALASMACSSMGTHSVSAVDARSASTRSTSATSATSWEEVFARPAPLRITAFNTGAVYTGTEILIEGDNPKTPESLKNDQWVPAIAYLVEHPSEGRVLFDTGVPSADAEGRCDFGRWPLFSVPCRAAPDQNIRAQLARRGLHARDLRFIAVSHFHGDHAGGLLPLIAASPSTLVLATGEEWEAVEQAFPAFEGYLTELLNGSYAVRTFEMGQVVEMRHVGKVLDFFGDGSVWILPATGHSRGQFAALFNAQGGPVIMTFDAAHLAASVELRIPPGFVVDRDAALSTIDRLAALTKAFPGMRVFYGHEPSQWTGKPRVVSITE